MNNKNGKVIYFLLGIIIVLLIYLIIQSHDMGKDILNEIINNGSSLSRKIDTLTSYVK